ncbi:MAG: hypothetical protein K2X82_27055 [Gemmataceae bacterium]|nr:hypothetical protein [Gemmataceae bacterium]
MDLPPIVRNMIVCNDWRPDPANGLLIDITGLLYNLRPPAYPYYHPELCVLLALAGGRGEGEGWIVCENDDTGREAFATPRRRITFGSDPLAVVGVPFRVRRCAFPAPGLYSVQFWYNDRPLDRRLMNLR